jgi:hypothetical protein
MWGSYLANLWMVVGSTCVSVADWNYTLGDKLGLPLLVKLQESPYDL